ncbi:hypothetical protein [Cupriavidus sp. CuC1]|uniref:hypothetical protein n=1 Tax=Cupriavidus sp. CuC1 TaxID=3373131 RepID=UPI0037DDA189
MSRIFSSFLLSSALLTSQGSLAQSYVECKLLDKAELQLAPKATLLYLRCRARQTSYEAERIKGASQKFKDDLLFACQDQVIAVEHQLRVSHGFTRESLARERCDY